MASLPVEVLLGIYLGLLVGIVPALVAWGLGFVFRYVTGVTVPGFAVVVLAITLAGVNGGLLALADRTVVQSPDAERVLVAILVVAMGATYAHAKGDQMGATFPRRFSLRGLRERTLSADVVELVGGRGEVRVRVVGPVADVEGYPPLPDDLRVAIRGTELRFPADLRLADLESRTAERLRTEFDLAEVSVDLDERARATVAAAPPFSGLSKRVPDGRRAVSVDALVPTGLARGDEVGLSADGATVDGVVVSARSDPDVDESAGTAATGVEGTAVEPAGDGTDPGDGTVGPPAGATYAPTTDGGEGRVTVTVPASETGRLLDVERARVVVRSRGAEREYELGTLLRRAGRRFRRVTVRNGSELAGRTLGDAGLRERFGVAALAVRAEGRWRVAPPPEVVLSPGADLFAVGTVDALDAFEEAIA